MAGLGIILVRSQNSVNSNKVPMTGGVLVPSTSFIQRSPLKIGVNLSHFVSAGGNLCMGETTPIYMRNRANPESENAIVIFGIIARFIPNCHHLGWFQLTLKIWSPLCMNSILFILIDEEWCHWLLSGFKGIAYLDSSNKGNSMALPCSRVPHTSFPFWKFPFQRVSLCALISKVNYCSKARVMLTASLEMKAQKSSMYWFCIRLLWAKQ